MILPGLGFTEDEYNSDGSFEEEAALKLQQMNEPPPAPPPVGVGFTATEAAPAPAPPPPPPPPDGSTYFELPEDTTGTGAPGSTWVPPEPEWQPEVTEISNESYFDPMLASKPQLPFDASLLDMDIFQNTESVLTKWSLDRNNAYAAGNFDEVARLDGEYDWWLELSTQLTGYQDQLSAWEAENQTSLQNLESPFGPGEGRDQMLSITGRRDAAGNLLGQGFGTLDDFGLATPGSVATPEMMVTSYIPGSDLGPESVEYGFRTDIQRQIDSATRQQAQYRAYSYALTQEELAARPDTRLGEDFFLDLSFRQMQANQQAAAALTAGSDSPFAMTQNRGERPEYVNLARARDAAAAIHFFEHMEKHPDFDLYMPRQDEGESWDSGVRMWFYTKLFGQDRGEEYANLELENRYANYQRKWNGPFALGERVGEKLWSGAGQAISAAGGAISTASSQITAGAGMLLNTGWRGESYRTDPGFQAMRANLYKLSARDIEQAHWNGQVIPDVKNVALGIAGGWVVPAAQAVWAHGGSDVWDAYLAVTDENGREVWRVFTQEVPIVSALIQTATLPLRLELYEQSKGQPFFEAMLSGDFKSIDPEQMAVLKEWHTTSAAALTFGVWNPDYGVKLTDSGFDSYKNWQQEQNRQWNEGEVGGLAKFVAESVGDPLILLEMGAIGRGLKPVVGQLLHGGFWARNSDTALRSAWMEWSREASWLDVARFRIKDLEFSNVLSKVMGDMGLDEAARVFTPAEQILVNDAQIRMSLYLRTMPQQEATRAINTELLRLRNKLIDRSQEPRLYELPPEIVGELENVLANEPPSAREWAGAVRPGREQSEIDADFDRVLVEVEELAVPPDLQGSHIGIPTPGTNGHATWTGSRKPVHQQQRLTDQPVMPEPGPEDVSGPMNDAQRTVLGFYGDYYGTNLMGMLGPDATFDQAQAFLEGIRRVAPRASQEDVDLVRNLGYFLVDDDVPAHEIDFLKRIAYEELTAYSPMLDLDSLGDYMPTAYLPQQLASQYNLPVRTTAISGAPASQEQLAYLYKLSLQNNYDWMADAAEMAQKRGKLAYEDVDVLIRRAKNESPASIYQLSYALELQRRGYIDPDLDLTRMGAWRMQDAISKAVGEARVAYDGARDLMDPWLRSVDELADIYGRYLPVAEPGDWRAAAELRDVQTYAAYKERSVTFIEGYLPEYTVVDGVGKPVGDALTAEGLPKLDMRYLQNLIGTHGTILAHDPVLAPFIEQLMRVTPSKFGEVPAWFVDILKDELPDLLRRADERSVAQLRKLVYQSYYANSPEMVEQLAKKGLDGLVFASVKGSDEQLAEYLGTDLGRTRLKEFETRVAQLRDEYQRIEDLLAPIEEITRMGGRDNLSFDQLYRMIDPTEGGSYTGRVREAISRHYVQTLFGPDFDLSEEAIDVIDRLVNERMQLIWTTAKQLNGQEPSNYRQAMQVIDGVMRAHEQQRRVLVRQMQEYERFRGMLRDQGPVGGFVDEIENLTNAGMTNDRIRARQRVYGWDAPEPLDKPLRPEPNGNRARLDPETRQPVVEPADAAKRGPDGNGRWREQSTKDVTVTAEVSIEPPPPNGVTRNQPRVWKPIVKRHHPKSANRPRRPTYWGRGGQQQPVSERAQDLLERPWDELTPEQQAELVEFGFREPPDWVPPWEQVGPGVDPAEYPGTYYREADTALEQVSPSYVTGMMTPEAFASGEPGVYRVYRTTTSPRLEPGRYGGLYFARDYQYALDMSTLGSNRKLWAADINLENPFVADFNNPESAKRMHDHLVRYAEDNGFSDSDMLDASSEFFSDMGRQLYEVPEWLQEGLELDGHDAILWVRPNIDGGGIEKDSLILLNMERGQFLVDQMSEVEALQQALPANIRIDEDGLVLLNDLDMSNLLLDNLLFANADLANGPDEFLYGVANNVVSAIRDGDIALFRQTLEDHPDVRDVLTNFGQVVEVGGERIPLQPMGVRPAPVDTTQHLPRVKFSELEPLPGPKMENPYIITEPVTQTELYKFYEAELNKKVMADEDRIDTLDEFAWLMSTDPERFIRLQLNSDSKLSGWLKDHGYDSIQTTEETLSLDHRQRVYYVWEMGENPRHASAFVEGEHRLDPDAVKWEEYLYLTSEGEGDTDIMLAPGEQSIEEVVGEAVEEFDKDYAYFRSGHDVIEHLTPKAGLEGAIIKATEFRNPVFGYKDVPVYSYDDWDLALTVIEDVPVGTDPVDYTLDDWMTVLSSDTPPTLHERGIWALQRKVAERMRKLSEEGPSALALLPGFTVDDTLQGAFWTVAALGASELYRMASNSPRFARGRKAVPTYQPIGDAFQKVRFYDVKDEYDRIIRKHYDDKDLFPRAVGINSHHLSAGAQVQRITDLVASDMSQMLAEFVQVGDDGLNRWHDQYEMLYQAYKELVTSKPGAINRTNGFYTETEAGRMTVEAHRKYGPMILNNWEKLLPHSSLQQSFQATDDLAQLMPQPKGSFWSSEQMHEMDRFFTDPSYNFGVDEKHPLFSKMQDIRTAYGTTWREEIRPAFWSIDPETGFRSWDQAHVLDVDDFLFPLEREDPIDVQGFAENVQRFISGAVADDVGYDWTKVSPDQLLMRVVKRWLTPIWMTMVPRYHINNIAGNVTSMMMAAMRSDSMYTGQMVRNSRVMDAIARPGSGVDFDTYIKLNLTRSDDQTQMAGALWNYHRHDELNPALPYRGKYNPYNLGRWTGDTVERYSKEVLWSQEFGAQYGRYWGRDLDRAKGLFDDIPGGDELRKNLTEAMGLDEVLHHLDQASVPDEVRRQVLDMQRGALARSRMHAYDATQKALRDYRMRSNLDIFLDRFLPVHFWSTKNLMFVSGTMLDRPAAIMAQARAYDQYDEKWQGLPPSFRNKVQMADIPGLNRLEGLMSQVPVIGTGGGPIWIRPNQYTNPALFAIPQAMRGFRDDWQRFEDMGLWERVLFSAVGGSTHLKEMMGYRVGPQVEWLYKGIRYGLTGDMAPEDRDYQLREDMGWSEKFAESLRYIGDSWGAPFSDYSQPVIGLGGIEEMLRGLSPFHAQIERMFQFVYPTDYTRLEMNGHGYELASMLQEGYFGEPQTPEAQRAYLVALQSMNGESGGRDNPAVVEAMNRVQARDSKNAAWSWFGMSFTEYTPDWQRGHEDQEWASRLFENRDLIQIYDASHPQKTPATTAQWKADAEASNKVITSAYEAMEKRIRQSGYDPEVVESERSKYEAIVEAEWAKQDRNAPILFSREEQHQDVWQVIGEHRPGLFSYWQANGSYEEITEAIARLDARVAGQQSAERRALQWDDSQERRGKAAPFYERMKALDLDTDNRLAHASSEWEIVAILAESNAAKSIIFEDAANAGVELSGTGALPQRSRNSYDRQYGLPEVAKGGAVINRSDDGITVNGTFVPWAMLDEEVRLRVPGGVPGTAYEKNLLMMNDALGAVERGELQRDQRSWFLGSVLDGLDLRPYLEGGVVNPKFADAEGFVDWDAWERAIRVSGREAVELYYGLVNNMIGASEQEAAHGNHFLVDPGGTLTVDEFIEYGLGAGHRVRQFESALHEVRGLYFDAAPGEQIVYENQAYTRESFASFIKQEFGPGALGSRQDFDGREADTLVQTVLDEAGNEVTRLVEQPALDAGAETVLEETRRAVASYMRSDLITPGQEAELRELFPEAFSQEEYQPEPDANGDQLPPRLVWRFDPRQLSDDAVFELAERFNLRVGAIQDEGQNIREDAPPTFSPTFASDAQAAHQTNQAYREWYDKSFLSEDQQAQLVRFEAFTNGPSSAPHEEALQEARIAAGENGNPASYADAIDWLRQNGDEDTARYGEARIKMAEELGLYDIYDAIGEWASTSERAELVHKDNPDVLQNWRKTPEQRQIEAAEETYYSFGMLDEHGQAEMTAWNTFLEQNSNLEAQLQADRSGKGDGKFTYREIEAQYRADGNHVAADFVVKRMQLFEELNISNHWDAQNAWLRTSPEGQLLRDHNPSKYPFRLGENPPSGGGEGESESAGSGSGSGSSWGQPRRSSGGGYRTTGSSSGSRSLPGTGSGSGASLPASPDAMAVLVGMDPALSSGGGEDYGLRLGYAQAAGARLTSMFATFSLLEGHPATKQAGATLRQLFLMMVMKRLGAAPDLAAWRELLAWFKIDPATITAPVVPSSASIPAPPPPPPAPPMVAPGSPPLSSGEPGPSELGSMPAGPYP